MAATDRRDRPHRRDPVLRVFLSHTSELRDHPTGNSFVDGAERAVIRTGNAVTDMAYFGVRDRRPADHSVRMVETADVYVGIIGLRYGSPVQDRPELSYTELEYETATRLGLPRLVFLLDETAELPVPANLLIDRVYGDRQEAFRARLQESGLTIAPVASPAELELLLHQALVEEMRTGEPLFSVPVPLQRVVRRPDLMAKVMTLLQSRGDGRGTVVPTTAALRGAGGFGKTTLAAMVCQEVRGQFPGGVLWVTLGEQVGGAELAAKVNDLALQLSGQRPTFVGPEQAGHHLGRLLGTERRFLVIDDVWRPEQLAPFLSGGPNCTRLITTRIDSVLPEDAVSVAVDAMTAEEARDLLTDRLGDDVPELAELLRLTGRWPVLLRLVNSAIRRWVRHGASVALAVSRVAADLRLSGPAALDRRRDDALDVLDQSARAKAVSATVEASLNALRVVGAQHVDRYLELAVFHEDVDVPLATLERLWNRTGGLGPRSVERLCLELEDLALVQEYHLEPTPRLRMHEVLLGYLKSRVGEGRLPALHRALIDAHRPGLPVLAGTTRTEWWRMPEDEPYLWRHLARHLGAAGDGPEAAELPALVHDLRWVVAKLERLGPAAVDADLALAGGAVAEALRLRLAQSAHLFEVLEPRAALGATLLARLEGLPDLDAVVQPYAATFPHPRLTPAWPLPDRPHPAALRALRGQGGVEALAVGPGGAWVAAAGDYRTLQLWNLSDGSLRAMRGHPAWMTALAAAPDGTWLASAGHDAIIRIWNTADGSVRARLAGHDGGVLALAVSADGTWLASAGVDGIVRVWATGDGALRAALAGHEGAVRALCAGPDGSWLASAGDDRVVRLWNAAGGPPSAILTGHADTVRALGASPDGAWLASAGDDRRVHLWNAPDGSPRAILTGHEAWVRALCVSPDGTWLASAGDDRVVRLWNAADGSPRTALTGHTGSVRALGVGPDGSWLASAGLDRTVRLWVTAGGAAHPTITRHTGPVRALAVAPDRSWLASGGDDHTVRLWNADGSPRATLSGHTDSVRALAVALEGSWLASAGHDHTIRLWDVATGEARSVLTGHTDTVRALALSPDGTWLASAGNDRAVRLWNVDDASPRSVLTGPAYSVTALVISPDGAWLATAGHDRNVHLWDAAEGTPMATLTGHAYSMVHPARRFSVTALAVSPDGTWLASGGHDHTVRLWNTADGSPRDVLTGHSDTVRGLAVSPDGAWLASVAEDQTVRLWSVATHECMTALRVDGELHACCWLSSAPPRLAVAGEAGVYLLDHLVPGT
jgi:WD40 repeat protein